MARKYGIPSKITLFETMALVELTQGKVALISLEDIEVVGKYKWYLMKNGYAVTDQRIDGKRKCIYMHRLVMNPPDNMEVDHINRNRLDNRRDNLRICTHQENKRNNSLPSNSTTGYKGVTFRKDTKKWMAQIEYNGKHYYLGSFSTPEEAAVTYNKRAMEVFGSLAYLNVT